VGRVLVLCLFLPQWSRHEQSFAFLYLTCYAADPVTNGTHAGVLGMYAASSGCCVT